jgi:hypothetical protein
MTRNQRKKAYLQVLDLMDREGRMMYHLNSRISSRDRVEFYEVLDSIPDGLIGEWIHSTHEDDKNFIALCVALCDEPL